MKRILFFLVNFLVIFGCSNLPDDDYLIIGQLPKITPDYTDLTIPPNIAPLNFSIDDAEVKRFYVELIGGKDVLRLKGKGNQVQFPLTEWSRLVSKNKGETLSLIVYGKKGETWLLYDTIYWNVANHLIDDYLVYRLIRPGYTTWNVMGIYQRKMSTFDEDVIVDSRLMPHTCMNCHAFASKQPDNMLLHLRENNSGTVLVRNNKVQILDTNTDSTFAAAAFPYWHPSGKYIAFSINRVRQMFNSVGESRAHAMDLMSDMVLLDVEKNEMFSFPEIFSEENFEAFPAFSPDGHTLYYVTTPAAEMPVNYKNMLYTLCAVAFDDETGMIGPVVDTLVSASQTGRSVSLPRPSPDGRFLMFNMMDYGNFPAYNPEADLFLYNLKERNFKRLDILNSEYTESYHSWSSNGRWVVFSSRRIDGLYSNPYVAFIDEMGNATKPFILPQKNPDFYNDHFFSFNVPEFVTKPVSVSPYDIERVATSADREKVLFRSSSQY